MQQHEMNEEVLDESATARLELVLGAEGLAKLRDATVMVFGLGGVGSNCVEALVRGGVGHFILIDSDIVQPSNINRQAIAFPSTVGRRKTSVMRDMVLAINPHAQVETHDVFVLPDNLEELFEAHADRIDFIVDAIDTVSAKLALALAAQERGIPLIASMGAANKLRTDCFRIADLYSTSNCPLCRVMRREGRKRGIQSLRVVYSFEEPLRVAPESGEERPALGTASWAPPIMGQMAAGEVIRGIVGLA